MKNDFFRVAAAAPVVKLADCHANAQNIIKCAARMSREGARLVVFPELSMTGYTLGDLVMSSRLLDDARYALGKVVEASKDFVATVVVGLPVETDGALYNCAAIVSRGTLWGLVPKIMIPNYGEFYERRWFCPGSGIDKEVSLLPDVNPCRMSAGQIFDIDGVKVGVEICEDLWSTIPPSSRLSLAGAEVIVNLSASNDVTGKYSYLSDLIRQQSARCLSAYVYASSGWGESSTDLVFDPKAIIAENGTILQASPRWQRSEVTAIADIDTGALRYDRRHNITFASEGHQNMSVVKIDTSDGHELVTQILHDYSTTPFVPADEQRRAQRAEEILNIQATGLAKRLEGAHASRAVIGISGGLDSTLALLVTARAFDMLGLDRSGIIAVTMPGFGTTGRTRGNAHTLMNAMGVTSLEIPIAKAVNQHFSDIGHDGAVRDVTYENSQARERTQILMDLANKYGGLVIGTGDLSELALGWATYNGDLISMYGVNAGVPKTLVRHLVKYWADMSTNDMEAATLRDIIDTPISPELLPADDSGNIMQVTEDLVGPYELHDFFLYHTLRYGRSPRSILRLAEDAFKNQYDRETILKWLRTFFKRFFSQQFKRSCLPDGPKVGSVCLSPRGDWRMPSDACADAWLRDIPE